MKKTILVLAANPTDTPALRLDKEVREIDNGLQRSKKRAEFSLQQRWASRPTDVRRAMLDFRPNIVHFCGHGSGEDGIALEEDTGKTVLVKAETLARFFKLFSDTLECVVLNACYSEAQADAIVRQVPFVIGMSRAISDSAAIEFSVAFYDALAAGNSYEFAYNFACNAVEWLGTPEPLIPVLKTGERPTKSTVEIPSTSTISFRLTPKLPCLLLIDCSGSMSGAPIDAVKAGLRAFVRDMRTSPEAAERVELAIVTFGSNATVVRGFADTQSFVVPEFSADGATAMGEALTLGLQLIEMRRHEYNASGVPFYQPMLVLLTDGEPTDAWQAPVNRILKDASLQQLRFIPVALNEAAMDFLQHISPPSVRPVLFTRFRFSEMFSWLSSSMNTVLESEATDIDLPQPVDRISDLT